MMLPDHSLHHAAELLHAHHAIPILVSPPHHLLHLQTVELVNLLPQFSSTSSWDSFSPRLDMTEESSEEEMNLMNDMDKKDEDQLHAYPSQSVSKKSKTCLIFSLAFILMAIMERNSSSSMVPLLSWKGLFENRNLVL